jgi:uncharacterized integral membrane protein
VTEPEETTPARDDASAVAPLTDPETGRPLAPTETRAERLRRRGRHGVLYTWATIVVVMLVVVIALVVANTRQVKVSWVFGDSHASLVWLVLISAIAGWLGGIATAILFRRRTRSRS